MIIWLNTYETYKKREFTMLFLLWIIHFPPPKNDKSILNPEGRQIIPDYKSKKTIYWTHFLDLKIAVKPKMNFFQVILVSTFHTTPSIP